MTEESAGDNLEARLSRIPTLWTVVCNAHHGPAEVAHDAQRQLLDRYEGAIRRYLLAALRSQDSADELFQEFALRFLHGDFRNADPQRGRFRDYVKTILYHLIANYHKKQARRPLALGAEHPEPAVEPEEVSERDAEFLASWRDDLLARAWQALERVEAKGGQPFYTILRFRAEHPDLASAQMAEELSGRLQKPISATAVRQAVHRAREKIADLLVEEVVHSLGSPSMESLEQELMDLGLLEYCRPALQRREQGE
jgi:RNA polymerase sigma-70 factor (ECF subfamily)